MVSQPYGGILINRVLTGKEMKRRFEDSKEMAQVNLDKSARLDAEKIAIGAFSPLEGFMCRDDYEKVLNEEKLSNGLYWTIPIILAPRVRQDENSLKTLSEGDDVALFYSGQPLAILHLEEKFGYDKKEMALRIYGTLDSKHPGVGKLYKMGKTVLGGRINLIRDLNSCLTERELTPLETRQIFQKKTWETIAAYQTRNPPHMAHEYLQRCALEIVDGIFIHPIVGELKKDDFPPEAIVEAYQFLIENYYTEDRVILATLSITMRYAGPKEAIFLAIIRKNYGCTHFIVGRDLAGVGNYYDPYAAHKIFKNLDLGIEPILFRESFYCKHCSQIATDKTCGHIVEERVNISMTKLRENIVRGIMPPREVMRPEIAKILMKYGSSSNL